tara:strand:- start:740 stop:2542 length:1803 start_codon:yes stop_codon:yes gene_type:complete
MDLNKRVRRILLRVLEMRCWYLAVILLLPQTLLASVVLFDDAPQNGASLWPVNGTTSVLSSGNDPVASGTHSIALTIGTWSQAGLKIDQVAPAWQTLLRAMVYRVAGDIPTFTIRHGTTWAGLVMSNDNNTHWTIDGQPGNYTFSNNQWHVLEIDLDGLGISTANIVTLAIRGGSGTGEFFIDDVEFVSPVPMPPVAGQWTLTFEDNFSGTELDPAKWRVGAQYLGGLGKAGNSTDNIYVDNGNLYMYAEKRSVTADGNTFGYASGEISTFKNFRQKYGYFEARVKYDVNHGTWPAFWLMPDRGLYGANDNVRREAFIKFDLDSVPATVNSAILRVKVSTGNAAGNLTVHPVIEDWDESTVTWNTKPTYAVKWLKQITGAVAGQTLDIDVTSYIQNQKNMGLDANLAFVDIYMKHKRIDIYSRDHATAENRPVLIVNGTSMDASEDAYVRGGAYADNNYGTATLIKLVDPWQNTASTYDGGMEFDIMETLGVWGDDVNSHALHWDGYAADHQSNSSGKVYFAPTADDYHTYGMYWEEGHLEMYIDGVQTWSYTNSRIGSVTSYILLSLQLGGWDGNQVLDDNVLPTGMYVDYVRVWQSDD